MGHIGLLKASQLGKGIKELRIKGILYFFKNISKIHFVFLESI